jgi:hypothetical protein
MKTHAANGKSFWFSKESEIFKPEGITKIENHYNAKFIFDSCVKDKHGNWANMPMAIFYQADASKIPEGGSQYFGMYLRSVSPLEPKSPIVPFIINGLTAIEPFQAVVANNGEVVWSRYRHDYRKSQDGSVWIDGGRDYLRWIGAGEVVNVRVNVDHLEVI